MNENDQQHCSEWLYFLQVDHKKGFGGKFGVETDKVDKSAKGWSEHYKPELHPSQTDHKKGFGGKFGVEDDRRDEVYAIFIAVCLEHNHIYLCIYTIYIPLKHF